jgi:short-subunit dehydrogenase
MEFMIQTPNEVADECLHALGQGKYAIATGSIQKAMRFISNRLFPSRLIIDTFSDMIEKNQKSD